MHPRTSPKPFLNPLTTQICAHHPPTHLFLLSSLVILLYFSPFLHHSLHTPETSHHHPTAGPAYLPSSQQGSDIISFQVLPVQSLNPFNKRIKEKQEKTRGFYGPNLAGCRDNYQLSSLKLTELWMIKQMENMLKCKLINYLCILFYTS